jgi:hypothetical protein
MNPSNISYNIVLRQVDVFFKIVQERDYDLIIPKLVVHLHRETQLSNKDSCVEMDINLFIHKTGETWKSEIRNGDNS